MWLWKVNRYMTGSVRGREIGFELLEWQFFGKINTDN